ncbi:hypothetical protein [Pseudovibrio sp. Tun.PSC04-5.I4]|uniref:hypothetical protein n=1 Tax=Pseudovibrio sp. Tun.PSC04-5.I4 TaxID=1798213 RepID=UPI0008917477|nr:hypothetical protein [Pseudovibrio sp. Tun.PSC04-5.I4]SDQ99697.1 hypothetical protein SAMN04515695_2234 [Pseudovibrio sp. Tun.PSC04-5.I4]
MLARTVTRFLTIAVLRNTVLNERRILDTQFMPVDRPFKDGDIEPLAVVYTEKGVRHSRGKIELDLVIDIAGGVKSISEIRHSENGPVYAYEVEPPESDGAAELACDLVEDDIAAALMDIENPIGDVWREFCELRGPVQTLCGADDRGVRRATRRLFFPLNVPRGLSRGRKLTGAWDTAVSVLEAHDMSWMNVVGQLIRTRMEQGNSHAWVNPAEMDGLTQSEVKILHMPHPINFSRTEEPPAGG